MGASQETVSPSAKKSFSLVIGPFLDIALRKINRRLDWSLFTERYLGGVSSEKMYYHFDYYRDDYRGSLYLSKLESLGFKIALERLPSRSREIVKELVGIMAGADLGYLAASNRGEKFIVKVVCPFKDLRYPLELTKKSGAHICIIDFSEPPSQLVSLASELIILSESENIYLSGKKPYEEKK